MSGAGTTTNSSGVYTFTQIAPGSYTVTVTATGYTGQTSSPFSVNPGATTTQNFQLVSTAKPLGVVQSFGKAATTAGTTLTATTGTATTLGDLLVVTVKDRSSTLTNVTGITDSSGLNTWAKATGIQSGGQADEEIWYVANAKSVTSVTVTVSGSASLAMTVIEISGAPAIPARQDDDRRRHGHRRVDRDHRDHGAGKRDRHRQHRVEQHGHAERPDRRLHGAAAPAGQGSLQRERGAGGLGILTVTGAQSYAATLSASVAWAGAIAPSNSGRFGSAGMPRKPHLYQAVQMCDPTAAAARPCWTFDPPGRRRPAAGAAAAAAALSPTLGAAESRREEPLDGACVVVERRCRSSRSSPGQSAQRRCRRRA